MGQRPSLAAVVLGVWLALGLAGRAHAGDGTALLKLVPADSSAVLAINVDRLRRSPLFDRIAAWLVSTAGLGGPDGPLAAAGIDLRRDLSTVVLAGDLSGSGERALIYLEGRFDDRKVAALAGEGAVARTYRGIRTFEAPEATAALVGKTAVLAPGPTRMRAVIDLHRGRGRSAAGDRRLSSILRTTDTRRDLWILAAPTPGEARELARAARLDGISSLGASVDLRRGMVLAMRLTAAGEAGARKLAEGLSETARMVPVLAGLKVARKGRIVDLSIDLDPAELEKLLRLAGATGAF